MQFCDGANIGFWTTLFSVFNIFIAKQNIANRIPLMGRSRQKWHLILILYKIHLNEYYIPVKFSSFVQKTNENAEVSSP